MSEAEVTLDPLLSTAPPHDAAVVAGPIRLSTAELDARIDAMAAAFNASGVGHGDRVAFQLPTGIDALVVYRACWRSGAVAVALHPAAGTAQLQRALDQAEPALVLASPGMMLAGEAGVVDPAGLGNGTPVRAAVHPDDDAVILFTSGSSGTPKGAIHSHRGLAYKARQSRDVHGLTADDCVLMPAPLAHVSGLLHGVLVPGLVGAKAVLMERWDPGAALDLIEGESVTWMIGPPTFFIALMDHADFSPDRTESLRLLSCGGAAVTPAFAERARHELGAVVKRAYGSTEAPTVTTSRHDDPSEQMIATDGRAFGSTELRVDDHGELWVRGPEVARGYLDPEATAEAFVDGWFRTGDLALLDDGWLTITGRLGDRIIRGGENISATEVEQHLEAHPAVSHAAVLGEPDERLGERVVAFVVAPDGFDLETCRRWFAKRGAARFSTPERVVVVDELPVLASGKVDRIELAARF